MLLFLILLSTGLINTKIKRIHVVNSESFVKIETTKSEQKQGPDISKLVKIGRIFFARLHKFIKNDKDINFQITIWYFFENNDDVNELQMICHKGEAFKIEWCYVDDEWYKLNIVRSKPTVSN